jgi:type III secretion protein J
MKRFLLGLVALLSGCAAQIQSGLDEVSANEVETVLVEHGLSAKKIREGGRDAKFAISVPAEQATAAIQLLRDNDLPHTKAPGFGEIFGKGSMVPTATEEKAMFLYALSGEISRTLETVEGVVSARVHVVPAAPSRFGQPPAQARAAVLIKVGPGKTQAMRDRRQEIQLLVAGSVDGLDANQVAVMVTETGTPPEVTIATPRSENFYRVLLVSAAAVIGILAMALLLAALRVRKLRESAKAPVKAMLQTNPAAHATPKPSPAKAA